MFPPIFTLVALVLAASSLDGLDQLYPQLDSLNSVTVLVPALRRHEE